MRGGEKGNQPPKVGIRIATPSSSTTATTSSITLTDPMIQ